ncbi:MAG: hypothetical protein ACE5PT_06115 [Gemmatimonadales bacterium]
MLHETITSLAGPEVLARAKRFFAERVPHQGAFLEHEGERHATFRGQGGEELTVAVFESNEGTLVRASTLLFDQAIGRFFSTLPVVRARS